MKTRFKKLFLLAIVFLTPNLVNAESACTYEQQAELNNIVANVKASYEVVDIYAGKTLAVNTPNEDGTFPEVDNYVKEFQITLLNVTEDIYVKVSNNQDDEVRTFKNSDAINGVITFLSDRVFELTTFTFEIYANKYSCIGEQFRKFTITTPMYNSFSKYEVCNDNPDFYYCQEFIPTENISSREFYSKINEYQEEKKEEIKQQEKNKSFIEKLKEFCQNNKLIVYSIGIVIGVAGVATTVILVKKKRSRVL